MFRSRIGVAFLIVVLLASPTQAFGPLGHTTIGAIADKRLANEPVRAKISGLLDGLTLSEAALLPDKIKDWDRKPPTDPDAYHLAGHPSIDLQLVAFWTANPPTQHDPTALPPNHHWFHYTDVPVLGSGTYAGGQVGRTQWDVVHMIPFCVKVLKGQITDGNERKITKPIALILLAHYVGDIHQPLHVGAQYFDDNGKLVDADAHAGSYADEGGNSLLLILDQPSDHGHAHSSFKLHSYWDDEAVTTALDLVRNEIGGQHAAPAAATTDESVVQWLATHEPAAWKSPASLGVEQWAEAWADEILPTAREAHERLTFSHIRLVAATKTASGQAIEKPRSDGERYSDWAGKVVRDELRKAGWRLAELLKQSVD